MNKAFVTLGVLLITVLAVLFGAPALVDWSRYRGTFEDEASRLIGRRVRVGEQVALRLLPTPYISFDNVRVADASGKFDTPLLRMESFRLQLSIGALLTGNLVAQDVELKGPTLRLAVGKDGRGNWAGLGPTVQGSDSVHWQGLALSTVHIVRGTLDLEGATEGQHWRLDAISGDLDADGGHGPYRFKGGFAQDGKTSDLRVSAAQDDSGGKLRLKASTHAPDAAGASFAFDGALAGLESQPSLTGTIEGKVPFANGPANGGLDFKSNLTASLKSATLDDIVIAVDGSGRPQRLTGTATIGTGNSPASVAVLTASWLDLDSWVGKPATPTPLECLQNLLKLAEKGPGAVGGNGRLQLAVEEASIGGAVVNNVVLSGQRTVNGFKIEKLTAKLPGQNLISARGDIGDAEFAHFDGQVRLWGANLSAVANWAMPSLPLSVAAGTNSYLFDTTINADSAHVSAERLRMEFSGTTLTGSARYVATPRSLSLTLDSDRLDLASQFDAPVNLAAALGLSTLDSPTGPAPAASLKSMLSGDTFLDLRIGRLITAQGALHDVSAKLERRNGQLTIPAIDVATDEGFTLHVEGALAAKDDAGQGQLRLMLAAPTPAAASSAVKIVGLGNSLPRLRSPIAALTPLTLAGTVEFGGKSATSESLALDGSAADSHVRLHLARDSGDGDWPSGQFDAAADVTNPDARSLLAQVARSLGIASAAAEAGATTEPATPGTLSLRASGVPEDGLATRMSLTAGQVGGNFGGNVSVAADAEVKADGTFELDAPDTNRLLKLTGLSSRVPDQAGALKLAGRIHRDATMVRLGDAFGRVGGVPVAADLTYLSTGPVPKLTGTVQAESLALDRWLGLLTKAPDVATVADDTVNVDRRASVWPDRPFDFSVADGYETNVRAFVSRLDLGQGYRLGYAQLGLNGTGHSVTVSLDSGHSQSGDWSGKLRLEKEAAGAMLHLDANLAKARLDTLGSASSGLPRPHGDFALTVSIDSKGLTPADLASSAEGKGSFSLGAGAIDGFSSNSVDAAARIVLAEPALPTPESLKQQLATMSRTGTFAFLGANGSLTVADGKIRFDRLRVDSSQSQLEIANHVDLSRLQLLSSWTLQPKPVALDKAPLPAVPFSFAGRLAEINAIQPTIDITDLQRDIEARKLLGGAEAELGIWPSETTAISNLDTAQRQKPVAEASIPAGKTPVLALPASVPETAPAVTPAPLQSAENSDAVTPAPSTTLTALTTAAPADAPVKRAPARIKKKKIGWATSLFQDLFGN